MSTTSVTRVQGHAEEGWGKVADAFRSLGFWRACTPMPWVGPGSFGHPGSGGSVGFADTDAGAGFGYVTNLWSFRIGEPRASNLAAAVVVCLG